MAQGTAFWTAQTQFLDEEFDAPDDVADRELCRAIAAGRMGLHPDGWGNHDPLPLRWLLRRRPERELPGFGQPLPVEPRPDVWNEHKPKPKPLWHPRPEWKTTIDWTAAPAPAHGEVQLTCDDCRARFRITMYYRGNRPAVVQSIRLMGKDEGWTCILGRDRCPQCSQAAAPEPVGNSAGGDQGDKQHA